MLFAKSKLIIRYFGIQLTIRMCGAGRVYLEGQTKTWPISALYLFLRSQPFSAKTFPSLLFVYFSGLFIQSRDFSQMLRQHLKASSVVFLIYLSLEVPNLSNSPICRLFPHTHPTLDKNPRESKKIVSTSSLCLFLVKVSKMFSNN